MPVAGEEGYEETVICPYEKSHEIRRGRLQFHLDKCRKHHKDVEKVQCPFNSTHLIPKVEEQYHTQEECNNRNLWDRAVYDIGDPNCPVKDLVPVNAGNVPDGEENWDDFEAQGSVLNTIKAEAAEKNIFRMLQCESKAKRREFREQERLRHSALGEVQFPDTATVTSIHEPLRRPTRMANVPISRQDPQEAIAAITKQFRTLDMSMKPTTSKYTPSETSSMCNAAPSTIASLDSASVWEGLPSTSLSRPSTSMSVSTRMSTAASIAESANRFNQAKQTSDDGFCTIPIPGLGRGARRRAKQ